MTPVLLILPHRISTMRIKQRQRLKQQRRLKQQQTTPTTAPTV
jgi:hypothetical protein